MSTNPETPQNTERPLQQDGEPTSPEGQEMALQSGKKTITYVDYFLQLHFGESEDAARTTTHCAVKKVLTGMDIENQEDIDDIDSQCILDVCSSDEKLSFMDGTRTRKFLSKIGHPGFLSETLSTLRKTDSLPGSIPLPPISKIRKPRNSGFIHASDLAVFQNPSTPMPPSQTSIMQMNLTAEMETPARRHVGRPSAPTLSDNFAEGGGGPGGLGDGKNIHLHKSAAALNIQLKARVKMATAAITDTPVWDGTVEEWFDFSEAFLIQMAAAGFDIVCRPKFLEKAHDLKWSDMEIVEARSFVWTQLRLATKTHKAARNALSLAGGNYDGETCFHQLELDNKVGGHSLEVKLRDDLKDFAPESHEDPTAMIARFNTLLTRYMALESAEIWNPERKIRKILELFHLWTDLRVMVDMVRYKLTESSTRIVEHVSIEHLEDPHLLSYAMVCRKAIALVKSFAVTDRAARVKINSTTIAEDPQSSSSESPQRRNQFGSLEDPTPENATQAMIQSVFSGMLEPLRQEIKILATNAKIKTPALKTPKGGPRVPLEKINQKCMHPTCGAAFEGFIYQQICSDCFQKIKADRDLKLVLSGQRDGTDFNGKRISIVASDNPRHIKRGAWKIKVAVTRLLQLFPDGFGATQSRARPCQIRSSHVIQSSNSVPLYEPLFFGADSCAGAGATGHSLLFHHVTTPVNWVIEGMKAGEEALVPVRGSGTAIFLVRDRNTGEELVLRYGGMLQCDPDQVSTSVGSSSQVGNFFNATKGARGARFHTANPTDAYMELPEGHQVHLFANEDGAFGCDITPLHPHDPRLSSLKSLWVSEDCIYRPPGRASLVPLRINKSIVHYRIYRHNVLDLQRQEESHQIPDRLVDDASDKQHHLVDAVNDVLHEPAMGTYSYIAPLSGSAMDLSIAQARMGGAGSTTMINTCRHGFGGKEIFSKAGMEALSSFVTTFSHPAASGKKHKPFRTAKTDQARRQAAPIVLPGQSLCGDPYHTGFSKPLPKYLMLFCDKIVPMGSCYSMFDKSGDTFLQILQEHTSKFQAEQVPWKEYRCDGGSEMMEGPAKQWMQSQRVKLLVSPPYTPRLNRIELKFVRHFTSVTTFLMLDSQLPLRFIETVGQTACVIISFLHISYDGRDTSAYFEFFKRAPDLRILKRIGCEVFFLLEKKDRVRFGTKGVRGVLLGIAAHTHPEWTYIVWSPITANIYFRRDVMFNENSMPFRDARALVTTPTSPSALLRRGMGSFTRSMFRDLENEEYNLDIWDSHLNPEPPLCEVGAAAWLPVYDHVGSPIQVGDTLFLSDQPTVVEAVSPTEIRVRNLLNNETETVSPQQRFFSDAAGLLTRGRHSTRFRGAAAFYTYDEPGGNNLSNQDVKLPNVQKPSVPVDGSDLVGLQFWDANEGESPLSYTIIGTAVQTLDNTNFKCLKYRRTDQIHMPATKENTETSRVREVRSWMDNLTPPNTTPMVETEPVIPDVNDDDDDVSITPTSLFTTDGIGEIAVAPVSLDHDETAAILRTKIRNFKIARRPKKIPRRVLIQVLKGKIKKAYFKYGVKVPESYGAAVAPHNPDSPDWVREMAAEIGDLSELGAFLKGLTIADLPEGFDIQDIIRSIWVFDVKIDGRKRARFAARGDMEKHAEDDDNFSPVVQMKTVRVLLAVAAQLNLEIVTMDFPKAFLLGKMDDSKPIYMYAPEGFGQPGEIWKLQLPLYGLTVSSRRFYESLSEFLRAIGFEHFAGGDPCLFRRLQRLPTEHEAYQNHLSAVDMEMKGRPVADGKVLSQALPRAPQSSRVGPATSPSYPYPEYMDLPEYKKAPNVAFETFHADGLDPEAINGLLQGMYYEFAACYVDDLLGLTHAAAALAAEFIRRFAAKISPPGSMYLGLNYEQNLLEGWIRIGFRTCLERTVERIKGQTPFEIGLRSLVGILLWLTLHIFGTHIVEIKALARRTNQDLPEDGKTALGLIYELYERRGQSIYFRRCDSEEHLFVPRASRPKSGEPLHEASPVPSTNGEICMTPKDILDADLGIDVYAPEDDMGFSDVEPMTIDPNFRVTIPTDASYAADQVSRRSDLGGMVCINGAPVDWFAILMSGIADSSFNAEYCAMSLGTKRGLIALVLLQFMGILPAPPTQFCDSSSAVQAVQNPHSLGAARSLGIRQHGTRYAIAKKGTTVKPSITEDMQSDIFTKRLARTKLARFSVIFFNNLKDNWNADPDYLVPRYDQSWYPDLKFDFDEQPDPDDWDDEEEEASSDDKMPSSVQEASSIQPPPSCIREPVILHGMRQPPRPDRTRQQRARDLATASPSEYIAATLDQRERVRINNLRIFASAARHRVETARSTHRDSSSTSSSIAPAIRNARPPHSDVDPPYLSEPPDPTTPPWLRNVDAGRHWSQNVPPGESSSSVSSSTVPPMQKPAPSSSSTATTLQKPLSALVLAKQAAASKTYEADMLDYALGVCLKPDHYPTPPFPTRDQLMEILRRPRTLHHSPLQIVRVEAAERMLNRFDQAYGPPMEIPRTVPSPSTSDRTREMIQQEDRLPASPNSYPRRPTTASWASHEVPGAVKIHLNDFDYSMWPHIDGFNWNADVFDDGTIVDPHLTTLDPTYVVNTTVGSEHGDPRDGDYFYDSDSSYGNDNANYDPCH